MSKYSYYCIILLTIFIVLCECKRYEVRLDSKFLFGWEVDSNNKSITLDCSVETNGYVGIGISKKGKMDGADMAMGGVKNNGKTYFGVYHGKHHKPVLDRKQNWRLLEASENSTHTFVKCTRRLDTGDSQNVPIVDVQTHIIWAIGKTDELKKHHGHGKYTVNLINPSATEEPLIVIESGTSNTTSTISKNSKSWSAIFRTFLTVYNLL